MVNVLQLDSQQNSNWNNQQHTDQSNIKACYYLELLHQLIISYQLILVIVIELRLFEYPGHYYQFTND